MNPETENHEPLVKPIAAAQHFAVSPKTLEEWRLRGDGPPFYKIGGRLVRYRLSEVNAWLQGRKRASTSQELTLDQQVSKNKRDLKKWTAERLQNIADFAQQKNDLS